MGSFIVQYLQAPLGQTIINFAHASPFLFAGLFVCIMAIGVAFTMPKK